MENKDQEPLSVADYIDLVNAGLQKFQARIVGEVSDFQPRSGYLFFTLKDKKEGGVINCFMWGSNYKLFNIELKEGLEIIISGYPSIYAKSGRLSFQTATLELVGEGALKKAYDELKKKLEKEGVFAEEKKRPLPPYPRNIGVITSRTGAVIHDFTNNLGRFGFSIKLIDSRVEGQQAVKDLILSVKSFKKKDIDLLVIMRGGGSLEALMAFNNERLVREISGFPVPVIAAIGHDKDVPLAALAADALVSTPTAAANLINEPWARARFKTENLEKQIINLYSKKILKDKNGLFRSIYRIRDGFGSILAEYQKGEQKILKVLSSSKNALKAEKEKIASLFRTAARNFSRSLENQKEALDTIYKIISLNNPKRQLNMGYSIIRKDNKIIKSVKSVKIGQEIDVEVSDGNLSSQIKKINKK